MKITTIASSSAGNCSIVETCGRQIILDCGVSMDRIRAALDYDLSKVTACLVTHEHGDHAKSVQKLCRDSTVPIYCTKGTLKQSNFNQCHTIEKTGVLEFDGEFGYSAIKMQHDVECYGFIIHGDGKLLYATDTGEINYTIPGLTHLMIEANHSFELLIDSGVNTAARKRIAETHLSIDDVLEFVGRHPDLQEIHLMHLSDCHSDAAAFKTAVQSVAGVPVYVVDK